MGNLESSFFANFNNVQINASNTFYKLKIYIFCVYYKHLCGLIESSLLYTDQDATFFLQDDQRHDVP